MILKAMNLLPAPVQMLKIWKTILALAQVYMKACSFRLSILGSGHWKNRYGVVLLAAGHRCGQMRHFLKEDAMG